MKKHNYNQPLPPNPYNPLSWISQEAVIGDNAWIGAFVYIGAHVEIGDNVSISNGVQILDHDNSYHRVSEGKVDNEYHTIQIGSFTQVGANSVILAGYQDITIGDHCIVGALSFVNRNVPPYSVVVGSPAKVIRHLSDEVFNIKMNGG